MHNWVREENLAMDLARWVMDRVRTYKISEIRHKENEADLVTDYDVFVEDYVRNVISNEFPDHQIIAEERGQSGPSNAKYCWYIDPVDGTNNFANGISWSSFSICLAADDEPVVGVIADLGRNEIFHAVSGFGAFCNNESISVRNNDSLSGCIAMVELINHLRWPGFNEVQWFLEQRMCTIRIMGSSALALANVAAGRASVAVLGKSNAIDVAAGVLIAREAGATVVDRDGSANGLPHGGLVAGNAPTAIIISKVAFELGS